MCPLRQCHTEWPHCPRAPSAPSEPRGRGGAWRSRARPPIPTRSRPATLPQVSAQRPLLSPLALEPTPGPSVTPDHTRGDTRAGPSTKTCPLTVCHTRVREMRELCRNVTFKLDSFTVSHTWEKKKKLNSPPDKETRGDFFKHS